MNDAESVLAKIQQLALVLGKLLVEVPLGFQGAFKCVKWVLGMFSRSVCRRQRQELAQAIRPREVRVSACPKFPMRRKARLPLWKFNGTTTGKAKLVETALLEGIDPWLSRLPDSQAEEAETITHSHNAI